MTLRSWWQHYKYRPGTCPCTDSPTLI